MLRTAPLLLTKQPLAFADFSDWLKEQKEGDLVAFFRKTVAVVIMWNLTETIVRKQQFGGYRHAIVTYTLAWFHEITDLKVDLDRIWSEQKLDDSVTEALELLCVHVNEHIRDTDRNVTEWAKKEACWIGLKERARPELPKLGLASVTSRSPKKTEIRRKSQAESMDFCSRYPGEAWFALSKWLKERDFMQGKQRSQCFHMGRKLKKGDKPSAVLSAACQKIWEDAAASYGWDWTDG